jgi:hypothetical protein
MTPVPDEMRIYQAKQSSEVATALLGYFEMVSWSKGDYYPSAAALNPTTIRIPSLSTDGPGKRSTQLTFNTKGEKQKRTMIQDIYFSITSSNTTYFHL